MGKSDIQKLKEFVRENRFTNFRFQSERQSTFDPCSPLREDLYFDELLTNEYPDTVLLRCNRGIIVIDRLKRISLRKYADGAAGEITLITERGGYGDGREESYKIMAKKFL